MNKKSCVFRYFTALLGIVFITILFWRGPNLSASTRPDTNVYFFPDGQRHSTVNVDVTVVASTNSPGGFVNLYYEWWFNNPDGDNYPLTNEAGEVITIQVPEAKGETVVKFNASNFVDRGNIPVSVPGKYYVRVYAETKNGITVANSLLYSLRKDTAGHVEIIEINEHDDDHSVGYVWIKINYVGMYTGNDSTITSKVYKIGEDGEWQKYEGQFKVTKNTTIYAEYTDGIKTISSYLTITSIDSDAPQVSIKYNNNNYENPIVNIFEEKSGLASIKYGWVKYKKVNGSYVVDESGVTLWKTLDIRDFPKGNLTYELPIDKINDVQGDGYYKLHVIATDRVGNISEEVISSQVVEVDLTGPVVWFDDRGISQSQSYYEIVLNIDESDLGINPDGTKKLYFFMLVDEEVPFKVKQINGSEIIYDHSDYNPNYLTNVYQELNYGQWIIRDKETNKLVIRISPEYFTEEQLEQFNEKVAIYVKAVDSAGNTTLASTEITYHMTYQLPEPGKLFVNASSKSWPYKVKYAQIVLVPEFSDLAKYYFEQANEYYSDNLEVYYTAKYSLSDDDINAFNELFVDFGNYKKISNIDNLNQWLNIGGWKETSEYQGGYIGLTKPREIRITQDTNDKVVRVLLLDRETGLVEIYDSYELNGKEVPLQFNNIDNEAPTVKLTPSNWAVGQKVGQSVIVDVEINDNYGFRQTALVQYQWTDFNDSDYNNLAKLNGKWRVIEPQRITPLQPGKLISYENSIVKTVGDGRNYLWIRVVDSVGNETLYCQEFVVDTTPPQIDLKVRNMNKLDEYLTPEDYHLLLEPTVNNNHVRLDLRVFEDFKGTGLKLKRVLYRWVVDQGVNSEIPWEEVSQPNLTLLSAGGILNEEINYVEYVGTGYYRLEVKAIDIAGNESEVVSSPVFCIINRAPYEPTIIPVLTYDPGSKYGVIEVIITSNDPTVDDIFKYALIRNGDFTRQYNSISKPTFEYSDAVQYIKAKSINQVGNMSIGYSELYLQPKWFVVPKVKINDLGLGKTVNLDTLKSALHNIRDDKFNTAIETSYKGTNFEFDKIQFAISSTEYNLDNINKVDLVWYDNLTVYDIEELVKGDGTYRLWVRVYNEYQVTPVISEPEYKPLYIAYDYVDINVDNTNPEVEVHNQVLVYDKKDINLLDPQFVTFGEPIKDLDIEIYVNGLLLNGTTIRQDAGIYKVTYIVKDLAGNKTVSDELVINVQNIVTLVGINETQTLHVKYGVVLNLTNILPDIPERMKFLGWYHDEELTLKVDSITVQDQPITLYAKYAYVNTYITLNPNGGFVEDNVVVVPYGSRYVILPTPTRENYNFLGWYHNDKKFEIYDVPTEDITLVARWEGVPLVLVIDANNGSELITIESKYGETVGELPIPTKEGYDFVGWFFNGVEYNSNSIITQNTVLIAKYEPHKLSVVFNSNNGTTPTVQKVEFGSTLQTLPTPTRLGYEFVGWYINEGLTTEFNTNQAIIEDIFLYAKWEKQKFTVTFNVGDDATFEYDTVFVPWLERLTRPTKDPVKKYYKFVGWFKDLNDRFPYDFNTPITDDLTLHARWVGIDINVTFRPGNGLEDFIVRGTYGEVIKAPVSPVKTGYTFIGWFLNTADEESFDFSTPLTNELKIDNLVLHGRWELNEYDVTIDPKNNDEILYLTLKYNQSIGEPTRPSRTGYIFKGWRVNGKPTTFPLVVTNDLVIEAIWEPTKVKIYFDDCYDKVYEIEVDYESILKPINIPQRTGHTLRAWYRDQELTDMYSFDEYVLESFTLYAKWELNYYRISFETNGGTKLAFYQGFYGSSLSHLNPVVEKEGYTFKGWYKDRYFNEVFDFSTETMPAYNFTIYAKWEINTYQVNFETFTEDVVIEPVILKYGQVIQRPAEPVREGYYFAGWYTTPEYDIMYVFGGRMPAKDVTVYARWLKEFAVTFHDGEEVLGRDTVTETNKIKMPQPAPTKYGYQFAGWYLDPDFTNLFDFDTIVSQHVNLYARWETKQTTINFNSNGGSPVNPIVGYYGSELELPVPSREGHQFVGWQDSEGNFVTSVIVPHDDITLKAVWEANIYTVIFDSKGGSYIPPITAKYGTKITMPIVPVKVGYNFAGWYLDGEFYVLDSIPARNITLEAVWNQEFTPGLIFELTSNKEAYVVAGYTGSSQSVFIPSYYNNKPVIGIKNNAFLNKNHVIYISLPHTITSIGNYSFSGMTNLAQILVDPGMQLKSIGNYAFQNTPNLTSFYLPNGLESIGSYAFYNSGLRSIVIPKSVSNIGSYAFYNTKNLTDASFEVGSQIKTIPSYMFRYSGITSFVVPEGVTTIGDYAFANTPNLKEISFPASITKMGNYVLRYATRVETLRTPGQYTVSYLFYRSADMSKVLNKVIVSEGSTYVTSSFINGIKTITEVVLPESLTSINSYAFYNATGLKNINIPENVKTIGAYSFALTSSLSNIEFSEEAQLTNINDYAFDSSGITSIVIPKSVTHLGVRAFYNTKKLVSARFEEGTQIKIIPSEAFRHSNIASFVVPTSVTEIGAYAFANCTNLRTIVIPNNVTTIRDYILRYSMNLEEITIPGNRTVISFFYQVSDMPQVLTKVNVAQGSTYVTSSFMNGLGQIKTVVLPDGLTSINSYAFYNATGLSSINLPNTVTSIGAYSFSNTTALNKFIIYDESNLKSLGDYAFANSAINDIYLPSGVTTVGTYLFDGTKKLSKVEFSENIKLTYLSSYMFRNTTALKSIDLPKTLVTIEAGAFYGSGLVKAEVPYGVTHVKASAFSNMKSLAEVHFPVTVSKFDDYVLRYSTNVQELTIPGATTVMHLFYRSADMSKVLNKVIVSEGSTYVTSSFINGIKTITEVVLPESLTAINSYAFYNATGLKNINIPENVKTIGAYSFALTSSLSNIEFSEEAQLTNINEYAFDSSSITSIVIPKSVTHLGVRAFYNTKKLVSARFEEGTQIKIIPSEAFRHSNIASFVVPTSVTEIGSYAFANCTNLRSIVIPNNVTTIRDYILRYSMNIEEITIPGNRTVVSFFYQVSDMPQVLTKVNVAQGSTYVTSSFMNGLGQIKTVVLPDGLTSINSYAFYNATGLSSINLPNTVTSIGAYSFSNTTALNKFIIYDESNLKSLGDYAFANSAINDIYLPSGVTTVGTYLFDGTKKLSKVEFSENIKLTYLSSYMFRNTTALKSIDLPKTLVTIEAGAFYGSGLVKAEVPYGVTHVKESAFSNMKSLAEVHFPVTVSKFDDYVLRYSTNVQELTIPGATTVMHLFYRPADMSKVLTKVNVSSGSTFVTSNFANGITTITDVVLPESLTSINSYAFYNATGLKNINIPDNVKTIGAYSFALTTSLTNIEFGKDTKLTNINDYAFDSSSITSIVIPKTVTQIGTRSFYNTKKLVSARFEEGTQIKLIPSEAFRHSNIASFVVPTSVTEIGAYAFANCTNLRSIVIPNNVTTIRDYILRYSKNIEELTIPGNRTVISFFYQVSDMPQVLTKVNVAQGSTYVTSSFMNGLGQIKTVVLPDGLTSINSYAFYNATGLSSINIPDSVTSVSSYAFSNTSSLLTLNISESSKIKTLGDYAFANSAINDIYLPSGVTTVGTYLFDGTKKLSKVEFSENIKLTYLSSYMFRNTTALKSIDLPKTLVTIEAGAFYGSGLVKAEVPYGVTHVKESAFSNMKSLAEVHFPVTVSKFDDYVLRYSTNVQELTIPGATTVMHLFYRSADMSKVLTKVNVSSGSTFVTSNFANGITTITDVVLPESLTSINSYAFYNATGLKNINIPDNVKTIGAYSFALTTSLTNIEFGKDTKLTNINDYAFDSSSITSIVIPKTVTQIGTRSFYNTKKLVSARFEEGTQIKIIPSEAFRHSNIASFVVPTSVTEIGSYAFANCTNLRSIVIPNNVTTIRDYILRYSMNIEEITIPGNRTVISFFYQVSDMPQVLTKVTVATGSTYVTSSFLNGNTTVKEVVLPHGITSINGYAFYNATNLTTINIPETVVTIGAYAFSETPNLDLSLLNANYKFTSIGDYAFNKSGIQKVYLPSTISTLGSYVFANANKLDEVVFSENFKLTTIPTGAFQNTTSLKNINLPQTITVLGDNAFNGSGLVKLVLPNGFKTFNNQSLANMKSLKEVSIPTGAGRSSSTVRVLNGSDNIEKITFPGNTTLESYFYRGTIPSTIKEVCISEGTTTLTGSFLSGIKSVEKITLPTTLTTINANAFQTTYPLKTLVILSTKIPTLNTNTALSQYEELEILVLDSLVDEYKNSWTTLAEKIKGLS